MEQLGLLCLVVVLAAVPSVLARKCYTCSSSQNPSCADGYQTGTMAYQDCSSGGSYGGGGFGNQWNTQGGIGGQPGGIGQPGGFGQQPGQQQYGGYGDMNRCYKMTQVNPQGPAIVSRGCGTPPNQMMGGQPSFGATSDGCVWQGLIQTCTCDSNYCNGSSRFTPSRVTALLTGLLTLCAGVLVYRQSL